MLRSWAENLKYLWRSYEDFGMYNMCAKYLKKNPPEAAKVATSVKFFNVEKNLGMFPSSRFWDTFFKTLFNTYVYRRVSFSAVEIIISKEEEIFGPEILMP